MALVVFLRGVNVGGHRSFRPTVLTQQLQHFDPINIGAAGTFVFRRPVTQAKLRAELRRRLPFDAEVAICPARKVIELAAEDFFAGYQVRPEIVRFVSVLARPPRSVPKLPTNLPASGRWMVKVLARRGRFIVGVYRREMKVIGHLGALDRLFGSPVTTRNWKTIISVVNALHGDLPEETRVAKPLWTCPKCGAKLISRNLAHSCGDWSVEKFLAGKSTHGRALFERFVALIASLGRYDLAPAKTRVAFMAQVRFASVNRVSEAGIDVHFVLRRKLESKRFRRIEAVSDCFVHHLRLTTTGDFDDELARWLRASYTEYGMRESLEGRRGRGKARD